MESEEIIILIIVFAILANIVYMQLSPTIEYIQAFPATSWNFLHSLATVRNLIILAFLSLPLFVYLNYKINVALLKKIKAIREKKKTILRGQEEIENLLKQELATFSLDEMISYTEKLKEKIDLVKRYSQLHRYEKSLRETLKNAKRIVTELRHKKTLKELSEQIRSLENDIKQLDEEKSKREFKEEQVKSAILRKLEVGKNEVFLKEKLTEKEFKILLENGYSQTNEYCVYEKKLITVLVKTILNHSNSHTFLVWSVNRLLEKYKEIRDVRIHQTKDADITFRYKGKLFAIEIETGTLLRKKEQTTEKIAYLNRKYPKRWMIVVSNKDLIWKYRKFGFSTQRNEVAKNLEKMLKYDTRSERVE